MKYEIVSVVMLVRKNGSMALARPDGGLIGRWHEAGTLTSEVTPGMRLWLRWAGHSQRWLGNLEARMRRKKDAADPWIKKCQTWYSSCRLRWIDQQRARGKPTGLRTVKRDTWERAIDLMWIQANDRLRRSRRTGWDKWCETTSRSTNQRKGARYG